MKGLRWILRAQKLKRAISWIREADPNHLINGPRSWLVGHPGHDVAMRAFVGDWDAIGVEASFEQVPKIAACPRPVHQGRKTAVLVGLETYFSQSEETLRWRAYRSVVEGAGGIGLCPSGMLQARPDKVNFLRGLDAEFRGLASVITAEEPAARTTSDAGGAVGLMERVHEGHRYLLAVRDGTPGGPLNVRFSLPQGTRAATARVLFEGRSLPVQAGGFVDELQTPRSVHVYELLP